MLLEKISFAFFPIDLKFFFLHQLLQYFEFFIKLRWKLVTRLQVLKLVNFKFLPSVGLLHPAFIQFQFQCCSQKVAVCCCIWSSLHSYVLERPPKLSSDKDVVNLILFPATGEIQIALWILLCGKMLSPLLIMRFKRGRCIKQIRSILIFYVMLRQLFFRFCSIRTYVICIVNSYVRSLREFLEAKDNHV